MVVDTDLTNRSSGQINRTIEVKNNYKCRNEFVISDGAIIQAYGFNEKCISENNMGLCIMEGQMVFKLPL